MLKSFLIRQILYPVVLARQDNAVRKWRREGALLPPPHIVKQKAVRDAGRRFRLNTLVETGTFHGSMVEAQRIHFREIYSIELSQQLFSQAQARFGGYPQIHLLQGDSAQVLPELLLTLQGPALFWLDGHYSGGETALGNEVTPIMAELRAVLSSPLPHIILIDDARLFTGTDGYPALSEVRDLVISLSPGIQMEVRDDIISLVPSVYLTS